MAQENSEMVYQFNTNLILLFELVTGGSRLSVSESSRPIIQAASLDHELVLRRHATGLRSQHGNMDDTIVVNGKCFIISTCLSISYKSEPSSLKSKHM